MRFGRQVGHDAVARLWSTMTTRQHGYRESRWSKSPPRHDRSLWGIRRDQPEAAVRNEGGSAIKALTDMVHPIQWGTEVQNLYLPDLNAHLCYHDLASEEPVCVYLHGLGSASSADFPHIAQGSPAGTLPSAAD
jgi:hypothetical protein